MTLFSYMLSYNAMLNLPSKFTVAPGRKVCFELSCRLISTSTPKPVTLSWETVHFSITLQYHPSLDVKVGCLSCIMMTDLHVSQESVQDRIGVCTKVA